MLAHGFTIDMLADLAVSGLLTIDTRREQLLDARKWLCECKSPPPGGGSSGNEKARRKSRTGFVS
jgi:hypothetical protein